MTVHLEGLTNSTEIDKGDGVFDVLMCSVSRHIKEEYDKGRIKGSDYSSVYLGGLQSVLSESIKFMLVNEQIIAEKMKTEAGGLIDLEKQKLQEEIDLIIAKTAAEYEGIDASGKNTTRENTMANSQLLINTAQKTLLESKNAEQLAATTRMDAESAEKVSLIIAQTLGFKVDGKQKLLKQMFEGFAIETTTAGEVASPAPTTNSSASIEEVANSIYTDLGGSNTI